MKNKVFIAIIVTAISFAAIGIAKAESGYFAVECFQFNADSLQIVDGKTLAYEDSYGTVHISVIAVLENTTQVRREYIGATILAADMEELERIESLSLSARQAEMTRRNFKREEDMLYDWFERVDPENVLVVPRYVEPGGQVELTFKLEVRPLRKEDIVLLLQECSVSAE